METVDALKQFVDDIAAAFRKVRTQADYTLAN